MKAENFTQTFIELDRVAYYPNDSINGVVRFTLETRIHVRSLLIRLVGYSKIKWRDALSIVKRTKSLEEDFRAYESYVDTSTYLVPPQTQHDMYLESGIHSYEFSMSLPDQLPTSFDHPLGRIAYKLILVATSDANESTKTTSGGSVEIYQHPFSVVNTLDLNRHGYFKQPSSIKISKEMRSVWRLRGGGGSGGRGTVTITLSLAQTGFVPGQHIPFALVIRNESNRTLRHVYVYLIQQVYVQASAYLRIVSRFRVPMPIGKGHTEFVKDGAMLDVPPVCESFGRSLIKVNYVIMVRLNKRDDDKINFANDYLTIPVFIGTRPFQGDFEDPSCVCFKRCVFGANYRRTDKDEKDAAASESDFRPSYLTYFGGSEEIEL